LRASRELSITRLYLISGVLAILFLVSCAPAVTQNAMLPVVDDFLNIHDIEHRKHLRLGVAPGPYGEMFEEVIFPQLEKLGYTFEVHEFSNFVSPNFALADGLVDLNIFQHYDFLINFNFENDLALSAVTKVPTLPMALFSRSFDSLAEIEHGVTIVMPSDATNLSRALIKIELAGLIRLSPEANRTRAAVEDIIYNPLELNFMFRRADIIPLVLPHVDLGVVTGNFIIGNQLDIHEALHIEVLHENYFNVIVVRTEDLAQSFVRDIINVIYSDEFKSAIMDERGNFFYFLMPRGFR